MGIKNLWTLNVDELLVTDKLKSYFNKKQYEIFLPVNSQMRNIDLIFYNIKKHKIITIQVKGSRTYNPRNSEIERWGKGSAAWFALDYEVIYNPHNKVDFFIFVLHSMLDGKLKKEIEINYLIIPSDDLKKIVSKKSKQRKKCHFLIWIDPEGKRSFDFRNKGMKQIFLSQYLDNWDILK